MKTLALAAFGAVALASTDAAPAGGWEIAPAPMLVPGPLGSFDDFAIRGASILRTGANFSLFYIAEALSQEERAWGVGVARSSDGVTWRKEDDNPAAGFNLRPGEYISALTVASWNGEFRALCVIEREFSATSATEDRPPPRVIIARSEDGLLWQSMGDLTAVNFESPPAVPLRPCLYADSGVLHLWWIGRDDDKQPALCHSVSRDGRNWSRPNLQAMKEIDAREVSCVRAYPSGDFTILVYVAAATVNEARIVTKIARGTHAWNVKGPPEFPVNGSALGVMPEMFFSAEGARLFYSEPLFVGDPQQWRTGAIRGAVLRSAFCPKPAYVAP